jgi:hypothetical protein
MKEYYGWLFCCLEFFDNVTTPVMIPCFKYF